MYYDEEATNSSFNGSSYDSSYKIMLFFLENIKARAIFKQARPLPNGPWVVAVILQPCRCISLKKIKRIHNACILYLDSNYVVPLKDNMLVLRICID